MMDIEKLIERLNQYSQSLIAYELGADFADACMDAATALSTLQAENAQLRGELEYEQEHANEYHEECGQWEAENEKLRADLARVTAERDAAILDLEIETIGTPRACDCCKNREKSWCRKNLLYGWCKWEWRGIQRGGARWSRNPTMKHYFAMG